MTYTKPFNVTYTDMCIYIDNNIYQDKFDENLIYEYLYHISVMLARNNHYFRDFETYDYFGIYAATYFYMRLIDPRQFQDNGKIKKIKSILNYAKSSIYSLKVSFEQQHYYQINQGSDNKKEVYTNNEGIEVKLHETLSEIDQLEFNLYLSDISKTIKQFVHTLPYTGVELQNIYLSCLLTILNRITLDNSSKAYVNKLKKDVTIQQKSLNRLYEKQRYNSVILYDLPDSLYGYIEVLVNEIFSMISQDLTSTVQQAISSTANIKNLMLSCVQEDD